MHRCGANLKKNGVRRFDNEMRNKGMNETILRKQASNLWSQKPRERLTRLMVYDVSMDGIGKVGNGEDTCISLFV